MFLFLAIIWFILSARHWKDLVPLQYCIAGVIALGMIEGVTCIRSANSWDIHNYNKTNCD